MNRLEEVKVSRYRSMTYIPPLVQRAQNLAEQMECSLFASVEAGRLLQLLASQFQSGVIGELSTGCAVSSAWIVSNLSPGTTFLTLEENPAYAAAARALFDPLLNVRVVQGDWREFLRNWRFSMLFAGKHPAGFTEPELLLQSLREGSLILFDGLPPQDRLSLRQMPDVERLRDYWLNDKRLAATEVQVSPVESVLLATRA